MKARRRHIKPVESVADFKARLAAMLRRPDEPVGLRNKAHPCVVRKHKTYGYNHWEKDKQ